MLPLRDGDRVLILAQEPTLARSVERRGARPVSLVLSADARDEMVGEVVTTEHGAEIPLETMSVDHAIVPSVTPYGRPAPVLAELYRVLSPGGGLMLGVRHRRRHVTDRDAWTTSAGRRALALAGFEDVEAYGVRPDISDPRFLVPVEQSEPLRWFLDSMFLSTSPRSAHAARILSRAAVPRSAALLLFPDLAFVARRAGSTESC